MTNKDKPSKIPYIFFAFFVVVIAVNIAFIYISKKTWRGVVTQDSYQKGVDYNQTLNQVKQQRDLGWKMVPKYTRTGPNRGILSVIVTDSNGAFVDKAEVYVIFKRPTQEGFDTSFPLQNIGGAYSNKVSLPLSGQWDVEIVVTRGEDVFQEVKRYVIQ